MSDVQQIGLSEFGVKKKKSMNQTARCQQSNAGMVGGECFHLWMI